MGNKLYAEFGSKIGLKMCKNQAVEDNMLNSLYICSTSAFNEEPLLALTGRHSVIEYIYDGIYIDDTSKIVEEKEPEQQLNE